MRCEKSGLVAAPPEADRKRRKESGEGEGCICATLLEAYQSMHTGVETIDRLAEMVGLKICRIFCSPPDCTVLL